jgi:hypothetical protein
MKFTPPTWAILWDSPPEGFIEPVDVIGNYCPATFRVHGLPYAVEFVIGVSKGKAEAANVAGRTRVVITSMKFVGPGIAREVLSHIPTSLLVDNAIHASTFIARAFPPNYKITSPSLEKVRPTAHMIFDRTNATYDSGPSGDITIHTLGARRRPDDLSNMKGEKPRGRSQGANRWNSPEMIAKIAAYWHECPDDYVGGRNGYIVAKLLAEFGHTYHSSTIARAVDLARKNPYLLIPKVNPKHNYRKKEGK